jgi:glucosyl-3-phosphoglycerate synthase
MALRVAAVIPARNEAERLPETLSALASLPGVSELVVVDDGSRDATSSLARGHGARVVAAGSFGRSSGKGKALLLGLSRARELRPDAVLLADADLGASASELKGLLDLLGEDLPVAVAAFPPGAASGGGFGLVKRLSRRAIARRSPGGYAPAEPLSGQRALLTPAIEVLPGIAPGFGAEVGMTLDLLSAGITPVEIPLSLTHRRTGKSPAGFAHRARQGLDILRAVRGARIPW